MRHPSDKEYVFAAIPCGNRFGELALFETEMIPNGAPHSFLSGDAMSKKFFLAILFTAIAAATVASSPRQLKAQEAARCTCNGGCENLKYYSYCGNGMCSWFCTKAEEAVT